MAADLTDIELYLFGGPDENRTHFNRIASAVRQPWFMRAQTKMVPAVGFAPTSHALQACAFTRLA